VFQAVDRHGNDEDQQGEGGGAHVKVVAGKNPMDGGSGGGQHLRFGAEKGVELVACLKEMPGHAEDQLHAEHRDDDKGAGFQEMIALHELHKTLGRETHGEDAEENPGTDQHQL
jgi:hypothetical protein